MTRTLLHKWERACQGYNERFASLDSLPTFACYTNFLTLPGSEIPYEMKDSLFEPFAPSE
jgi:hypothetical protein